MQLGQAVDKAVEPGGRGVWLAVPALVGRRVAQPEIGRAIDDLRRERGELVDSLRRRTVRQRQEQQIAWFELVRWYVLKRGHATQIRVRAGHWLACQPLRGHLRDGDTKVKEQQPQQVATDIATSTNNRNTKHI